MILRNPGKGLIFDPIGRRSQVKVTELDSMSAPVAVCEYNQLFIELYCHSQVTASTILLSIA